MKQLTAITGLVLASAAAAFAGSVPMAPAPAPAPLPEAGICSSPLSYSSVELDWNHGFIKESGFDDTDGAGIKLEYSPMSNLFLVAEGDYYIGAFDGSDIDGWGALVGVGGYVPLTPDIHFVTDLGAIFEGSKYEGDSFSDEGFYVRPHLRARLGCFETHLGAKYVTLNDNGDRWELFGDAYYSVTASLDLTVGAAVNLSDESDDWSLKAGIRVRF